MVLAPPVRHAGHPDDCEAGYLCIPSGFGIRRGTRGSRRIASDSSAFRRPTSSSTSVSTRRPSPRSLQTPANRNFRPQTPRHSSPRRPAELHSCVRQEGWSPSQPSLSIRWPFSSGFKEPRQLQGCHSGPPKRDGRHLQGEASLCFR